MTDATSERRHPEARCEECGLFDPKNAFVPSQIRPGARIAFVGEAPGFQESTKGEPFVGPSGRLLDLVLEEHGIKREEVILTNACLCRPPSNRTPTPSEVRCCAPRLKRELDTEELETIVTLGNSATQVLLDDKTGITKQRIGNPKDSVLVRGKKVIPTFHPAACLRSGDSFPFLVKDIGKINAKTDELWIEPAWVVWDDEASALGGINELMTRVQVKELVVDIEVGIDRDIHFGHPERYGWLCIGLSWAPDKAAVVGEEALKSTEVQKALSKLYRLCYLIAHNAKFDGAGLGGIDFDFDTMLASYVLDERPGTNSLDYCATEDLGAPPWKHVVHQYIDKGETYANIPRPVLYKYCAFDAAAEFQIYRKYKREMEEQGLTAVHDRLVWYTPLIRDMEMAGMGVDLDYHRELMEKYAGIIADFDEKLKPWVANPRSPKQVTEALKELGIGRVDSTDRDHLEDFLVIAIKRENEELERFIRLMLEQRKEAKLYGTYIKGLGAHIYQGRIHGSLNLHGTVTGRLAGKKPSLLNIPRGSLIKGQFIPDRPGDVFVQCDIRAAELRVMAVESRDEYLQGVLSDESRDIHSEVATRFFGEGFTKEQRVRAKAVVYGLGYGREAFSIASEFGISVHEAQRYLNTFFEVIPNVVQWKQQVKATVFEKGEDLVTHFGRHRRYWLITRDNMKDVEKEAYAFIPQSTANDINLTAAAICRYEHGLDVRLTVHDSILVQVEEARAEEVAELMQETVARVAREQYSDFVPFTTDVAIGKNWGEV